MMMMGMCFDGSGRKTAWHREAPLQDLYKEAPASAAVGSLRRGIDPGEVVLRPLADCVLTLTLNKSSGIGMPRRNRDKAVCNSGLALNNNNNYVTPCSSGLACFDSDNVTFHRNNSHNNKNQLQQPQQYGIWWHQLRLNDGTQGILWDPGPC